MRGDYDDETDVTDVLGDVQYTWTAPEGIELTDLNAKKPEFIAPLVSDTTNYLFSLMVNDGEYFLKLLILLP